MEYILVPDSELRYRVASAAHSAAQYVEEGLMLAKSVVAAIEKSGRVGRIDFLDFGCGCARMLQFLRLMKPEWMLTGCDVDAPAIAWDKKNIPYADFTCNAETSLPYADETFDAACALSVFTHLDIGRQNLWLTEVARVLRPGGILVFSTNGRHVFDVTRDQRPAGDPAEFDKVGFTFVRNIGDGILPDWYQTSYQTEEFLRKHMPSSLQVIDHTPKGLRGWQDLNVARRRAARELPNALALDANLGA